MMITIQRKYLICFLLLGFVVSGCQVFPYITTTATATLPEALAPTLTLQVAEPTATLELPLTTVETPPPQTTDNLLDSDPDTALAFSAQEGSPFTLPNFTHPESGCDWMGVAGQIFDAEGSEMQGLTVVTGNLLDEGGDKLAAQTGLALAYGFGGYEIQLSDSPVDSILTYWIQVYDTDGTALSDQVFFDTYDDCEKNLILINFVPQEATSSAKSSVIPEPIATLEAYP